MKSSGAPAATRPLAVPGVAHAGRLRGYGVGLAAAYPRRVLRLALATFSTHDPDDALRRLAAPFKQREATMERAFWASRFRR